MSAPIASEGTFGLAARRFRRHRLALASLAVLIVLALLSGSAPLVSLLLDVDAGAVDLLNRDAYVQAVLP